MNNVKILPVFIDHMDNMTYIKNTYLANNVKPDKIKQIDKEILHLNMLSLSIICRANHLKISIDFTEYDSIMNKIKKLQKDKKRLLKLNNILND